jgi:hypothetical protein
MHFAQFYSKGILKSWETSFADYVQQSTRARACAKNLRRHSRISTLRTKVEILGLQAYQNLTVSATLTPDALGDVRT